MYALQEVNQPSTLIRERAAPGVPPLRLPPPAMIGGRHRCRTVPQALVSRLTTGREPTPQEVEAVASRIWCEVEGWRWTRGLTDEPIVVHRARMIALARAALGLPPERPPTHEREKEEKS